MKRRPVALYRDLAGTLAWFGVPLAEQSACSVPVHVAQTRAGYYCVQFDGYNTHLHRLALSWRLRRAIAAGHVARHLCGNHGCVNPWHLEEGTDRENMRDQYVHGTRVRGERHPQAKLTSSQVEEVRRLLTCGERHQAVAGRFGVSRQTIGDIATGRTHRLERAT